MERREFWDQLLLNSNRDNRDLRDEFDKKDESPSEFHGNMTRKSSKKESRHGDRRREISTCQQLADIIGGEVITAAPVCVVQRLRNINATILGRRTQSPLALPFALSFENNRKGETLNLGETVILQKEINPFLTELRRRGLIVTAVHNHWLFDEPRLMYMHWENVGDPFEFARNSFEAARRVGLF
ncbi:DUF1259 domain-containing protein [Bacillus massilinigeriensis]|uniref:DUF1259 domain-containing protein n=1 Tax=Bacillus massilionigeriensis TaxID=1805475 RepID=UPI000AC37B5A|nr:DUF1259 domain-containing protein [Bacillus massilionigeriensis]